MKQTPIPVFGPAVTSVCAASTAGIALWLTRASFDVAGTTAAPIRVAMLPSLAELLGFVALALLICAGMASLVRGSRPFWEPATDALVPLYGLSLLMLPYLPWIPDWMPALRLLAGPGRVLVWFVVIGQVLWVFLPLLAKGRAFHGATIGPAKAAGVFAIVSVALSAPFVLNLRAVPAVIADVFTSITRFSSDSTPPTAAGTLGVLFDQEYGVLAYSPVLLLGFLGVAGMLRNPARRLIAVGLIAASIVVVALAASVDPWWNRFMMPGRPVFLLLPLLTPPIAWLYARIEPNSPARAGAQLLLLATIAVTLALVVFDPRVPALQDGDGASALLQWVSPTWHLPREVPTYVAGATFPSSLRALLWLTAFGVAAWILYRQSTSSPGRAALMASMTGAAVMAAVLTISSAVLPDAAKRFNVEERVMFPLLETFDPIARPIALRYDGFPVVEPHDLPPLFAASAVPGQRTDRQPVRVVLNARFRLPAGRYVLDLKGSDAAGLIPPALMSLQLGREGRPIESWPLTLGPGQRSRRDFDVPLDAEFVGFRAPGQVDGAIAELRVSPRDVVEMRKRPMAGTVLSAAAFAPVRVFFHDSFAFPESEGFWVKGSASARMTMLKMRESPPGVRLAVHGGARPNVVTLSTPGWTQQLTLVPGVTERVTIPSKEGERYIPLTISTADGFIPAEIEQSHDRRLLGAWIAFIPDDTARTSATP